jgi:hypothetical protein
VPQLQQLLRQLLLLPCQLGLLCQLHLTWWVLVLVQQQRLLLPCQL